MAYGIYVTKTNSNDNHQSKNMGWYKDSSYPSMKAAKVALEHVADMLNEEFFDYRYKNSVTIEGERTDTTPYPITERVVYHIEKR